MTSDAVISTYRIVAEVDTGRLFITDRGVAFQAVGIPPVIYGEDYFARYTGYAKSGTEMCLNQARLDLLQRYADVPTLDVGIGSGAFLNRLEVAGIPCWGYDINPVAIDWLERCGLLADPVTAVEQLGVRSVTLWDVLEHMPDPSGFIRALGAETILLSLPIVTSWRGITEWKHYKPGEHLFYFTHEGLTGFMRTLGYRLVFHGRPECDCGREDIGSYVFQMDERKSDS